MESREECARIVNEEGLHTPTWRTRQIFLYSITILTGHVSLLSGGVSVALESDESIPGKKEGTTSPLCYVLLLNTAY